MNAEKVKQGEHKRTVPVYPSISTIILGEVWMKVCPKCKMTVDAHTDCPVCKNDLTKEPYADAKGESYAFNKYLIPYLFRKHTFSIVCVAAVIVRMILSWSYLNWYCLLSLFCVFLSAFISLFKNRILSMEMWRFTEIYAEMRISIAKYAAGVIGVVISLFFW